MSSIRARLHALSIPFRMTFAHAAASRSACDSLIVELSQGGCSGYGEIVLREYVNGLEEAFDGLRGIARRTADILSLVTEGNGNVPEPRQLQAAVTAEGWQRQDLPLLAGLEGALLDLLCIRANSDIYSLLNLTPARNELRYGGVLPILPAQAAEGLLHSYKAMEIPSLRIKINGDDSYNRRVLSQAREHFGIEFDIRVDVNGAWDTESAAVHLEQIADLGVKLVEEPLSPGAENRKALQELSRRNGQRFVADESAVTFEDVADIATGGGFDMLNLRLAKNGGFFRTLELARRAEAAGLKYQLGCHVGETGILSAAGRAAASLMAEPLYTEGSFDEFLLAGNITAESCSFSRGGRAPVLRGRGLGYSVIPERLRRFRIASAELQ